MDARDSDDRLYEPVLREQGGERAVCRICGEEVVWTGGRFAHAFPRLPRASTAMEQRVQGAALGLWSVRTQTHPADPK